MTSSLCRSVIPAVPRIFQSFSRISSRLCSNESQGSGDKTNKGSLELKKVSTDDDPSLQVSVSSKYNFFKENEAPIILDVEEEKIAAQQARLPRDPIDDVFSRISEKRSENGVFELDEIVEVLKLTRAEKLCVISMPKEAKYVDYMVLVNGKSTRHMLAMAEFVRRVYKRKRHSKDPVPKLEGKKCSNWMALDLGNIAVHIFSSSAREQYDLESLWALGAEFDPISNKQDDSIVSLLERHSYVLDNLHPAD